MMGISTGLMGDTNPSKDWARVLVRVLDVDKLRTVYGSGIYQCILTAIKSRLKALSIDVPAVHSSEDMIMLQVSLNEWHAWLFPDKAPQEHLLMIKGILSASPILFKRHLFFPRFEVDFFLPDEGGVSGIEVYHSVSISATEADIFRQDMQLASQLLEDLSKGQLVLAFQPVASLDKQSDAMSHFYEEALLRRSLSIKSSYSIHEAIIALERLGLIERLDYSVVSTTIGVLEQYDQLYLSCNISAISLKESEEWEVLLSRLQMNPDVSHRLTLEISVTSPIDNLEQSIALVNHLKTLGVRIALDGVGDSYNSLGILIDLQPDFIKLNRSLLETSKTLNHYRQFLTDLVKFFNHCGDVVVFEGVETEEDMYEAEQANAGGGQGYFIAKPAIQPEWLSEDAVVVADVCNVAMQSDSDKKH